MPILIDESMMREIIMDHYTSPLNKKVPADLTGYIKIRENSASCIDDITIYLKVENGIVKDCTFDGVACAISTSSTDIMCDLVKEKHIDEVLKIIEEYHNMIFEKDYHEDVLEEAIAFKNTHKQAARIKCATIGWNGLKKLIEEKKNNE